MTSTQTRGNHIKHQLLMQHNLKLKGFAEKYGFHYALVSDVVRGINRCNYGKGKEIKDKLIELIGSLDPKEPTERQAA